MKELRGPVLLSMAPLCRCHLRNNRNAHSLRPSLTPQTEAWTGWWIGLSEEESWRQTVKTKRMRKRNREKNRVGSTKKGQEDRQAEASWDFLSLKYRQRELKVKERWYSRSSKQGEEIELYSISSRASCSVWLRKCIFWYSFTSSVCISPHHLSAAETPNWKLDYSGGGTQTAWHFLSTRQETHIFLSAPSISSLNYTTTKGHISPYFPQISHIQELDEEDALQNYTSKIYTCP